MCHNNNFRLTALINVLSQSYSMILNTEVNIQPSSVLTNVNVMHCIDHINRFNANPSDVRQKNVSQSIPRIIHSNHLWNMSHVI